jgi:hypothetical protein
MQLLNGEIYVFFVVFFISLMIIAVYDIIEPEDALVKNFVPFPNIKPTNLPGPDVLSTSYYPPIQK